MSLDSKTWFFNINNNELDNLIGANITRIVYSNSKEIVDGIITFRKTYRKNKLIREFGDYNWNKSNVDERSNLELNENYISKVFRKSSVKELNIKILEKNEKIEEMNNKLDNIKNDLIELKKNDKKSNVNITNNNMNNIILTKYTDPKLDISDKDMINIIKSCLKCVPNFIEHIYYNKNIPENHTIKYTNKRSNDIVTYNGDKWITKDKDDVLSDLIDLSEREIENFYYENKDKYQSIIEIFNHYGRIKDKHYDEIFKNVENVCYDNNRMIKK